MSYKDLQKLFDQEGSLEIIASDDGLSITEDLESLEYIGQRNISKNRYVPNIEYNKPENFAFYGSAEEYYKYSFEYIRKTFPYDGSLKEKQFWHNEASDLDNYIFDNIYPRTTGYINFSTGPSGWGSQTTSVTEDSGMKIAEPSIKEYIYIKGGPNQDPGGDYKSSYSKANIYDTYALRSTNLDADFDRGITVEFWYKGPTGAWPAAASTTGAPVIFDLWNGVTGSDQSYGRFTIFFKNQYTTAVGDGAFNINCISGSSAALGLRGFDLTGSAYSPINVGFTTVPSSSVLDGNWHHYAFVVQNQLNDLVLSLYMDGVYKQTLTASGQALGPITLVDSATESGMNATIGASIAHPWITNKTEPGKHSDPKGRGWNKISGSIDEFRFWKVARNSKEIGRNWFGQIGGGTNSDLSNVDLGIYYKFNEGLVGTETDRTILDYSGRYSNASFEGYTASYSQRSTGSAMGERGYAEYKDPIIYLAHPDYVSYRENLMATGSIWDIQNVSSIHSYFPGWILSEDVDEGDLNLKRITQAMASYLDELVILIKKLPRLKDVEYLSGSFKPQPFSNKKLESMGFNTYNLFRDAKKIESFLDKNEDENFEDKIYNVKNYIYDNIYNNLTSIFKSKGNEKSFKQLLHSIGIDEDLFKINLYANNLTYELKDNFKYISRKRKLLDFNRVENNKGTLFQTTSSAGPAAVAATKTAAINFNGFSNNDDFKIFVPTYAGGANEAVIIRITAASSDGSTSAAPGVMGVGVSGGPSASTVAEAVIDAINNTNVYGHSIVHQGSGISANGIVGITATLRGTTEIDLTAVTPPGLEAEGNNIVISNIIGDAAADGHLTGGVSAGSLSYISGSFVRSSDLPALSSHTGFLAMPRTYEVNTFFPKQTDISQPPFNNFRYLSSSIFGVHTHESSSPTNVFTWNSSDVANFQVFAVRDKFGAPKAKFVLTTTDGGQLLGKIPNASSTFNGLAALNADNGTELILINADGTTHTFTTSAAASYLASTSAQIGTGLITTAARATQSLHIAFTAAISQGYLQMTLTPATYTSETEITLTQNVEGLLGDTSITIPDNIIANGTTGAGTSAFTGGTTALRIGLESDYYEIYDNEKWNISVTLRPTDIETADRVLTGTAPHTSDGEYTVEFRGYNAKANIIEESFKLTGALATTYGVNILSSPARVYIGSHCTNFTGAVINQSDVRIINARVWLKYLGDDELKYHIYDIENYGALDAYRNLSIGNKSLDNQYIHNFDTLALNWEFDNITGSDAGGQFEVSDISSGSTSARYADKAGFGNVLYRHYPGQAKNFNASSADVIDTDYIPVARQRLPEILNNADMISILHQDDEFFPSERAIPIRYLLAIEKSMYQTISEEMINMFATIKEFNNVIGHPANRYRQEYKALEKLRQAFFDKVENTPDIEKYVEFYKWFDSSITKMLKQLIPASTYQIGGVGDTIESHVFERNKYWNKFPTLENKFPKIEATLLGINEQLYDYDSGYPVPPAAASLVDILTMPGDQANDDRFTVVVPVQAFGGGNTITIRFVSPADPSDGTANEIQVGLSTGATTRNRLVAAINGLDSTVVKYGAGSGDVTNGIAGITAANGTSDTKITITADTPTAAGNNITFTDIEGTAVSDGSNGSSPATLAGGTGNQQDVNCLWWKDRAERDTQPLTSGDSNVDSNKESIRQVLTTKNTASAPTFIDNSGNKYFGSTYVVRNLSRPYKFGIIRNKIIHGGPNSDDDQRRIDYVAPIARSFDDNGNYIEFTTDIPATASYCAGTAPVPEKRRLEHTAVRYQNSTRVDYESGKIDLFVPFTIYSSSARSGWKTAAGRTDSPIDYNDLHHDVYGPQYEVPMQGPFTSYHVGGQQSRHQNLNVDLADNSINRGEYWDFTGFLPGGEVRYRTGKFAESQWTFNDPGGNGPQFGNSVVGSGRLMLLSGNLDAHGQVDDPPDASGYYRYAENTNIFRTPLKLTYNVVSGDFQYNTGGYDLDRPPAGGAGDLWVQYSTDGTSWTTIQQHLAQGVTEGKFVSYEDIIGENIVPDGTHIYIRFIARATYAVATYDHWALDNINIYDIPIRRIRSVDHDGVGRARAVYYRDELAKRPVNIKNIQTTASLGASLGTIAGNYNQPYQVIQMSGRNINNLYLRNLFDYGSISDGVAMLPWWFRELEIFSEAISGVIDHNVFDRSPPAGSKKNKVVFAERFSAPGGPECLSRGYLDDTSETYSVYNTMNYRNQNVRQALDTLWTISSRQGGVASIPAYETQAAAVDGINLAGTSPGYENTIASGHRNSVLIQVPVEVGGDGQIWELFFQNTDGTGEVSAKPYRLSIAIYDPGTSTFPSPSTLAETLVDLINGHAGSGGLYNHAYGSLGDAGGVGIPGITATLSTATGGAYGRCLVTLTADRPGELGNDIQMRIWGHSSGYVTNRMIGIETYFSDGQQLAPSYHKYNRNTMQRLELSTETATPSDTLLSGIGITASYDNAWVQHHIPRSDFQYSWITASVDSTIRNSGEQRQSAIIQRISGHAPASGFISGSFEDGWNTIAGSSHFLPAIRFLSASNGPALMHCAASSSGRGIVSEYVADAVLNLNAGSPIWHPFIRLNMIIAEPFSTSSVFSETVADGTTHDYQYDNFVGYTQNNNILDHPGDDNYLLPLDTSYFNNLNYATVTKFLGFGNSFWPIQILPSQIPGNTLGSDQRGGILFNGLMLERNGPYGWCTWKQIRGEQHPLVKYFRNNNIISVIKKEKQGLGSSIAHMVGPGSHAVQEYQTFKDLPLTTYTSQQGTISYIPPEDDGPVTVERVIDHVKEPPLTDRYKPFEQFFRVKTLAPGLVGDAARERVKLKYTHGNNQSTFANNRLNNILNTINQTPQLYDDLIKFYHQPTYGMIPPSANPLAKEVGSDGVERPGMLRLRYKENVFPRERYAFLNNARMRTQFENKFWRDQRLSKYLLLYTKPLWYALHYSLTTPSTFIQTQVGRTEYNYSGSHAYTTATSIESNNAVFHTTNSLGAVVTLHYGSLDLNAPLRSYVPAANGSKWCLDARAQYSRSDNLGYALVMTGAAHQRAINDVAAEVSNILELASHALSDQVQVLVPTAAGGNGQTYTIMFTGADATGGTSASAYRLVIGESTGPSDGTVAETLVDLINGFQGSGGTYNHSFGSSGDVAGLGIPGVTATLYGSTGITITADTTGPVGDSILVKDKVGDIVDGGSGSGASVYLAGGSAAAFTIHQRISGGLSGLDGAGELQNDYCLFHNGDLIQSGTAASSTDIAHTHLLGTNGQSAGLRAACSYNRRVQETVGGTVIFSGDTLWQAGLQMNMENVIDRYGHKKCIGPFYDSYDDWAEDLRAVGKGYSILPEYRMSEHMNYYLKSENGYPLEQKNEPSNWLTLTGAFLPDLDARNSEILSEDFVSVYSTTDFLKYFKLLTEQHKGPKGWRPKNISLSCKTLKKFLPYEGFYPATRTLQLATLFSQSYGTNIQLEGSQANLRTVTTPLFAPGILYNTIKSGIAVDYPILKHTIHNAAAGTITNAYQITGSSHNGTQDSGIPRIEYINDNSGVAKNKYIFPYRASFDTLINPENLAGIKIIDSEPHSSASINSTGSINRTEAPHYTLAMNNFLAAIPYFFLQGSRMNAFVSEPATLWAPFDPEVVYRMFVVLGNNSDKDLLKLEDQNPYAYGAYLGGVKQAGFDADKATVNTLRVKHSKLHWDDAIRMYDRTDSSKATSPIRGRADDDVPGRSYYDYYGSSFGPPIAISSSYTDTPGAHTGTIEDNRHSASYAPFTPPYYNGRAVAVIDFFPPIDAGTNKYTVDEVLQSSRITYLRECDAPFMTHDWGHNIFELTMGTDNKSLAANSAMQIDASVNLRGKVSSYKPAVYNSLKKIIGFQDTDDSITEGTAWVIEPRFECPVLHFDESEDANIILPVSGSGSVASGMWHQYSKDFGDPNPDLDISTNRGVFLSILSGLSPWGQSYGNSGESNNITLEDELPTALLTEKYTNPKTGKVVREMADLAAHVGFRIDRKLTPKELEEYAISPTTAIDDANAMLSETQVKIGKVSNSLEICEAILAVPFTTSATGKMQLYTFPQQWVDYALSDPKNLDLLPGTLEGPALAGGGNEPLKWQAGGKIIPSSTVLDQIQIMKKYSIPPHLDFINNTGVDPHVMYIFEFKHTLDRKDLANIWQNLPPKSLMDIGDPLESISSIDHDLFINQFFGVSKGYGTFNFPNNDIRWLVFKVKQRAPKNFRAATIDSGDDLLYQHYQISTYGYNWPFDFFTMLELTKIEAGIEYAPGVAPLPGSALPGDLGPADYNFPSIPGEPPPIVDEHTMAVLEGQQGSAAAMMGGGGPPGLASPTGLQTTGVTMGTSGGTTASALKLAGLLGSTAALILDTSKGVTSAVKPPVSNNPLWDPLVADMITEAVFSGDVKTSTSLAGTSAGSMTNSAGAAGAGGFIVNWSQAASLNQDTSNFQQTMSQISALASDETNLAVGVNLGLKDTNFNDLNDDF